MEERGRRLTDAFVAALELREHLPKARASVSYPREAVETSQSWPV